MSKPTIFENGRKPLMINLDLEDYRFLKALARKEREPVVTVIRRLLREKQEAMANQRQTVM